MANVRYPVGTGKFAVLETNKVDFRDDQALIIDDMEFDTASFGTANLDHAENGMIFDVDQITRTVKVATDGGAATENYGIMYTSEKIYNDIYRGLDNFSLDLNNVDTATGLMTDITFMPRLGILTKNELFTTDCICYDDTEFTTLALFETALQNVATTPLYGYPSDMGAIKVTATAPTGAWLALQIVKWYTGPNDKPAAQFVVVRV